MLITNHAIKHLQQCNLYFQQFTAEIKLDDKTMTLYLPNFIKTSMLLGMVALTCHSSTHKAEAGGL